MAKSINSKNVTMQPGKPPVFSVLSQPVWDCPALAIPIFESQKQRFVADHLPPVKVDISIRACGVNFSQA